MCNKRLNGYVDIDRRTRFNRPKVHRKAALVDKFPMKFYAVRIVKYSSYDGGRDRFALGGKKGDYTHFIPYSPIRFSAQMISRMMPNS